MNEYSVVRGDTLSNLAPRLLGESSTWRELWQYNPQISDPDVIEVGDVIFYPDVAQTNATNNTQTSDITVILKNYWYVPVALSIVGLAIFQSSKKSARLQSA